MVTGLHFKQICECRLLTLVSKFADHYLSGQRRSPLCILRVQLPHCFLLGVPFTAAKSRLNRLRRWPSSCSESIGRISGCCMHFACRFPLAAGCTVHSQLSAFDLDSFTQPSFYCLAQLCTEGFPNRRLSQLHSTLWDDLESHFSVKFHRLGGDCFCLSFLPTSNFRPAYYTFSRSLSTALRNQIVATPGPTRQRRL